MKYLSRGGKAIDKFIDKNQEEHPITDLGFLERNMKSKLKVKSAKLPSAAYQKPLDEVLSKYKDKKNKKDKPNL